MARAGSVPDATSMEGLETIWPLFGLDGAGLLFYTDGTVRFRHRCDRGDRGVIICAPALQCGPHGAGHMVTTGPARPYAPFGTVTVFPSILCPDCGLHGFVTNNSWRGC